MRGTQNILVSVYHPDSTGGKAADNVDHKKVTFHNRYGITLAADMYTPKGAEGKLPAIAVSGPFGAVKEQSSGLYAQKMAELPFYCAHCGRKLQRTFGTDVHFYCVTPYWDTNEELCKSVRWDRTDIEDVVLASLKAQIAVMTVESVGNTQDTISEGTLLRQRLKALTSELESGDTQKVQSYLDYREGRITKEDFIALRSEREKRMEELKVQIAEAEAAYEDFLEKENQTKQEQAIIERTSSMNDEALKELMYDAVERINVTDNQNIEIVWKFDDLFATA